MKGLLAVSMLIFLSGCSTVFGDRYNHVNLTTTPPGAEYEVRNGANAVVASGVTPNVVKLKSSAGYFKRGVYNVRFHKDGYEDVHVPLAAGLRGIYWGNLIVSGPIGMLIVDPASGAMWALPRTATGELKPSAIAQAAPAVASPVAGAVAPAVSGLSKDEQIKELMQQNLSYEEYQRRYREINQ